MIILGIDPGFAIVGFGLIESRNGKQSAVRCGAINTQAGLPLPTRLLQIANDMEVLLTQFKPDAMAVEELFFNTNVTTVLGLMLSNGLVALAGALLSQYQGFSDINMGRGAIVIGLAAVIIGEVIFAKIFRNFALKLTAAIIGAIIYYVVIQFVLRLGLSTDDLKLLTALVVALFLTVPYWKGKYFTRPTVKKGGNNNA